MIKLKRKKKLERGLEGNIKWIEIFFFFWKFLDKFVLKTWINGRVFYFIDILSGVGDIFLLSCQVLHY